MTGSNAAEIIEGVIDGFLDRLEFGEALGCYERLQRFMERKKLEIETLAEPEEETPPVVEAVPKPEPQPSLDRGFYAMAGYAEHGNPVG
jgi:hypothetical protein